MYFLQTIESQSNVSMVLFFGTLGMLVLAIGLIAFIVFHQRKVIKYQQQLQLMEEEKQQILLNASISDDGSAFPVPAMSKATP